MEWLRKRAGTGGREESAKEEGYQKQEASPARRGRERSPIHAAFSPVDRALASLLGKKPAGQGRQARYDRAAAELEDERKELDRQIAELKFKAAALINSEELRRRETSDRERRGKRSKSKGRQAVGGGIRAPTFTPSPTLPVLEGYSGFVHLAFEQEADEPFSPIYASTLVPSSLLADTSQLPSTPPQETHTGM